jgi:hypothetical protein
VTEAAGFPWTFDQYQRYAALREALAVFFPGLSPVVLDVGGISPAQGEKDAWFPVRKIASGETFVLDRSFSRGTGFVQGDALALPFRDNSFDLVSALDVIEHISEEGRSEALAELSLVSRDLVLLSAPTAGHALEKAEAVLDAQVRALFGHGHRQLEEHRRHGLPEADRIKGEIDGLGLRQAGFSYGTVETWLFFQTLRHGLLANPGSEPIIETIDRFAVRNVGGAESRPPCLRRFWAASGRRETAELEAGMNLIRQRFAGEAGQDEKGQKKAEPVPLAALEDFSRAVTRAFFPETISGVILAETGGEDLRVCLQHLLTQKAPFKFEVSVWNIGGDPGIEHLVKEEFPAVTYLGPEEDKPLSFRERMRMVMCRLKGDHILIVDELDRLDQDGAARLYEERHREPGTPVIRSGNRRLFLRRGPCTEGFWTGKQARKKIKILTKEGLFAFFHQGVENEQEGEGR